MAESKLKLDTPIRYVKGIGEKKMAYFEKLGISTVEDLINFYPRDYSDRSVITDICDAEPDTECTILATIRSSVSVQYVKNKLSYVKFIVSDSTGVINITCFNQPWLAKNLKPNCPYRITGKLKLEHFARSMVSPIIEDASEPDKLIPIIPIYSLTKGLSQKGIRSPLENALKQLGNIKETLPNEYIEKYDLMAKNEAIQELHFPSSKDLFQKARRRLAFEEFFIFQLAVASMRKDKEKIKGPCFNISINKFQPFIDNLPFDLTTAQKNAINDVYKDLRNETLMSRLIQGDVGSGKTIVAAAAAYMAVKSGFQCALMVPTEILALQHYDSIGKMLSSLNVKTVCLVGGMTAKRKRDVLNDIESGVAEVIIGTHALLYENVVFNNLGLVITDEQHRFGVMQRSILSQKSKNGCHTLVMSATPIPRTLSLIMYGDLDVSIIDELPPGRQKVNTFCVDEDYRERLNGFVAKQISNGNQVYIICPMALETEDEKLKSVEKYGKELKEKVFKDFSVDIIHGKMSSKEKELIMKNFSSGKTDILVSTTVVEVGVNVPNATLMIVENAERFGLSQLHQLRGRVGRGKDKSYCILVSDNKAAKERLDILCETNDGFKIAEKDLVLRGPGDFIGSRQHGELNFGIADIVADMSLLETARDAAFDYIKNGLFEKYPEIYKNAHGKFSSISLNSMIN